MSVIMTFRAAGDPDALERRADGKIMVVDEWPDAESFQRFFEQARPEIEPMMQAVGMTVEPEIAFWRKLDTHDEVGWDA